MAFTTGYMTYRDNNKEIYKQKDINRQKVSYLEVSTLLLQDGGRCHMNGNTEINKSVNKIVCQHPTHWESLYLHYQGIRTITSAFRHEGPHPYCITPTSSMVATILLALTQPYPPTDSIPPVTLVLCH